MLNFLKKYPMSILLAIIAINLFSIARSLNTEAKLNQIKIDCAKYKGGQTVDFSKKYGVVPISLSSWCNNL